MKLPNHEFTLRNSRDTQLKLFELGYTWASGCTTPLYLENKDSSPYLLVVPSNKFLYKESSRRETDLTVMFSGSGLSEVHRCLENGIVYKSGEYFHFEPFTRELLDPDYVEEWMDWLETQTWQT